MLSDQVIQTGLQYLGVPYVFGAPSGRTDVFDCSSFTRHVFSVHGIQLPRTSRQQFSAGISVPSNRIQQGDLLFFTTKARKTKRGINKIGHVGIYMGNKKILHTYRQEGKVVISDLDPYWKSVYLGARRVI